MRPASRCTPSKVAPRHRHRWLDTFDRASYDLSRHQSKALADLPDVEFDEAVTMGCGDTCPTVRARGHEAWNIPDPRDLAPEQFRAVRDLIARKVVALLAGL